jgi:DNA-binding response OmpR family regulator
MTTVAQKVKFEGKILVADDERVNVEFFEVMLTKLGFSVIPAYDGFEVLEKLKDTKPDCILLDLLMPKMDGFSVIEKLKKNESTSDIPIIVLSAVSDVDKKVDLLELGIDDYIIKPFNFIEILARIRSVLRSKAYRDALHRNEKRIQKLDEFADDLEDFLNSTHAESEEMIAYVENHIKKHGAVQLGQKVVEREKKLIQRIENMREQYFDIKMQKSG